MVFDNRGRLFVPLPRTTLKIICEAVREQMRRIDSSSVLRYWDEIERMIRSYCKPTLASSTRVSRSLGEKATYLNYMPLKPKRASLCKPAQSVENFVNLIALKSLLKALDKAPDSIRHWSRLLRQLEGHAMVMLTVTHPNEEVGNSKLP